MKKFSKIKKFLILAVAAVSLILFWRLTNQYLKRLLAIAPKVNLTASPKSGDFRVGETKRLDFILQSANEGNRISGFDLNIFAEGNVEIFSVDQPESFPGGDSTVFNQVIRDVSSGKARLSYVSLKAGNELPPAVKVSLTFKGTAQGQGKIRLDLGSSQVVGNIEGKVYDFGVVDEGNFNFSGAAAPAVTVRIDPASITRAVGENFALSLLITDSPEGKAISGFDVTLNFDPNLVETTSIDEPLDDATGGDQDKFTRVASQFNNTTGEIVLKYVSLLTQDQLPRRPRVNINFSGRAAGRGELRIALSQVTGNIPENEYSTNIQNGSYQITEGKPSPTTPPGQPTSTPRPTSPPGEPSPTPRPTGPGGPSPTSPPSGRDVTLDLKLKFQGILRTPKSQYNKMDIKVTLAGGDLTQPVSQTGTFTASGEGIWTGKVTFANVLPLAGILPSDYKVLVKGPKHVQKKVCQTTPTETFPGTYSCGDGNITLVSGGNNLDFIGIYQLVGDLPYQDGVVNAYDASLVRNNLGKSDPETLSFADLNLDGMVNAQDYSLVIAALSVRADEY